MTINWKGSKADYDLIGQIVKRADAMAKAVGQSPIDQLVMDITAVHLNGNPLDLQRLLDADDFNFAHDVWGIHRHIDRTTGLLGDCFVPRLSLREQTV